MGKTSPVVVPVTADINPFRNAMRGLRSSFVGQGAGTGGFGSGGGNAGGVGSGGGGSLLGTAVGAGVGARLGAAPQGIMSKIAAVRAENRQTARSQASALLSRAREYGRAIREHGYGSMEADLAGEEFDRRAAETTAVRRYDSMRGRAGRYLRGLPKSTMSDLRSLGGGLKNIATGGMAASVLGRLGVPGALAGGLGAAALPVAGVAAVGMAGAAASRFKQSQYARFSNFEQYEGTKYYDIARRQAAGRPKEDSIGWWDKMWMEEAKSGGKMSQAIETAGGVFENVTSAIGQGMGMGASNILGGLADMALSSMGLSPSKGSLFNAVRIAY